MASVLEFRFFGSFSITRDGEPLAKLPSPRTAPLLAYLALKRPGTPVSRAALAAMLWPDADDEDAKSNLRRHLHIINSALPKSDVPWIVSTRSTLSWNPKAPAWIDLAQFEELSSRPEGHAEAIELFRGDLLEGYEDEWVLEQREELRGTYASLCHDIAQVARRARDFDRALQYLNRILQRDEWREDVVRLIMAVRHEAGDRAGALADFQAFSDRLQTEMHVAPMAETVALRDAILKNTLTNAGKGSTNVAGVRLPTLRSAFVGRTRELALAEAAWIRAGEGKGSTLLVGGVAGVGKSALVAQLVAMAQAQGGRVMLGATSPPEALPYEPIVLTLRAALPLIVEARIDRLRLAALARILPELYGVREDLEESTNLAPEDARARLTESVIQTISALSRARPLLLVLEDLHWAANGTLAMVEALARRIGALPVLLVLTFRSNEADASREISALRRRLQTEHQACTIALSNLAETDVADLVRAATAAQVAPEALSRSIFELSEGHPLFVAQLLQRHHEHGAIPSTGDALLTLDDAIGDKIAHLDRRDRSVAEAAAIAGNAFSAELVSRILGWPEQEVLDAFDTLFDRAVLRESGIREHGYAFTHALIQSSIYGRIAPEMRTARHRRVATILQQMGADRHYAEVARHWELAGNAPVAQKAYLRAARAALDVFDLDTAQQCGRKALALASDDASRFEVSSMLVRAYQGSTHLEELETCVSDMEATASVLTDEERFAAAEERKNISRRTGDTAARSRAVEVMLALARATSDRRKMATALDAAAMLSQFAGKPDAALAYFSDALAEAIRADDVALTRQIRTNFASVLSVASKREEAAALVAEARREVSSDDTAGQLHLLRCEAIIASNTFDTTLAKRIGGEMIALSRKTSNLDLEAEAHLLLGVGAIFAFDIVTGRREYIMAIELLEQIGHRQLLASAIFNLGVAEYEVGRFQESAALLERAETIAREIGHKVSESFALGCLAELVRDHGEIDNARALIERCLSLGVADGDPRHRTLARVARASILMRQGNIDDGKREMREAIAARRMTNGSEHALGSHLCTQIETGLIVHDVEFALEAGRELREILNRFPTASKNRTRETAALARVALAQGDAIEAGRWIEEARRALEARLAKLEEATDREAYKSHPFVRALPQLTADQNVM